MTQAKVLYIAGAGRSGSTLLEMLLGNLSGYFSIGEARHFFEYLDVEGKLCGCGNELTECSFWSAVIERLRLNPQVNLERAAHLSHTINRTRYTWQIQASPLQQQSWHEKSAELVGYLAHLYEAIWQQSGQQIIVDSSKVPSHLLLLSQISLLDLRALHLLRDGRAVAYSWSKRRKRQMTPAGVFVELPHRSAYRATMTWVLENVLVSRIGRRLPRYTKLHYESFVGDPGSELEECLNQLGLDADFSNLSNGEANLSTNHSVGGNPLRFQNKQQKIVLDIKWRSAMDPLTKLIITCLAGPWLLRYGYPLT